MSDYTMPQNIWDTYLITMVNVLLYKILISLSHSVSSKKNYIIMKSIQGGFDLQVLTSISRRTLSTRWLR